jgi:hypothetical protein
MTCDLASLGTFDVVLFLGVLYHLRDPFAALRRLRLLTKQVALVETAAISIEGQDDRPLLEFTPGAEVKNDPTNWFFPNEKGAIALLHAAGFEDVKPVARLFHEQTRPGITDFRLVLHARPSADAPVAPELDVWDWRTEVCDPSTAAERRIMVLEDELRGLRTSRTFRYSALPRRLYGQLRRRVMGSRAASRLGDPVSANRSSGERPCVLEANTGRR